MMKKARFISLVILFSVLITVLFSSVFTYADKGEPILYRNDTKYSITDYPPETIDGTLHVPVNFFVGLKGIQYVYNTESAGFYLRNETTGRFISFSFNAKEILVDNNIENVIFPISHSTVYMPLEYCADILSLKIEKISDADALRIRMCDGSEKLSFKELIDLYDSNGPQNPPEITPEDPNNPTNKPADRSMYITVDSCPNENTKDILKTLDDWGRKATFFFDNEGMKEYPEIVLSAFVKGHGIGISIKGENYEEDIKEAQKTLYSILNFNTRLIRCETEVNMSDMGMKNKLENMGYTLWPSTFDSFDRTDTKAVTAARKIYNTSFLKSMIVVRFTSSESSAKILNQLLYYMDSDKYITVEVLDPTSKDIYTSK